MVPDVDYRKKALQAAMLADGSDQSMALARVVDDEVGPAVASREVCTCVNAIELWFVRRQGLTLFGYTKTMLETLSTKFIWYTRGTLCHIGHDDRGSTTHCCYMP